MGISAGLVLLGVGAILAFAVDPDVLEAVEIATVGVILMAAGGLALLWGVAAASRGRST